MGSVSVVDLGIFVWPNFSTVFIFLHLISFLYRTNCSSSEEVPQVIAPKCDDVTEVLVLNNFGQPVCVCNNEKKFYPLEPSLQITTGEQKIRKCSRRNEPDICESEDDDLDFMDDEETLSCISSSEGGTRIFVTVPGKKCFEKDISK